MKQEENLILRQNDVGNDIVFLFDAKLDDITSTEFRLIKPDKTFVILTGTVEGNTATFTITEQCCAIPGRCHFNLRLINSSSNIYTYVSNCIIDINLNLEAAIESTAESNGYVFPDDFALKNEIPDTDEFATKNYVDTAISSIPVYTPPSYSTVEQNTGLKWIDGKHIYQKTLQFATNDTLVNITDLNIDNVVDYKGLWRSSDSVLYPLDTLAVWGGQTSNSYFSRLVFSDNISGVKIVVNGWTFSSGFITLYYTKTTDTV